MLELRHLRSLIAISEEGNLTRAAERLGIQQPPLTRLLRALETDLGIQLFERHARGVHPTSAGRSMIKGAYEVLERVEDTLEDVRRVARGESGELSIGFTNSAMCHPSLPAALGEFREAWPDVLLSLTEGNSTLLLGGIRDGTIDAAFIRTSIADLSDIVVELILDEPMVVALPSTHRFARSQPPGGLMLKDLADEDFILYQSQYNNGLYKTVIDACLGAGFTPNIKQKAPQLMSALNLVAGGLGVSLVPQSVHQHHINRVSYVLLAPNTPLTAPLYLVFRSSKMSGAKLYFIHQARRIRTAEKAHKTRMTEA
ncbi:LysR family transcriptional regulator [Gluconobacter wancherniae]|uniref:LysR family transcriptional regulator n=1 Tax=Gluconobacter wancherniae TaxID=1307955 RepID=UPI001B8C6E4B|nr:LysR family transcriptional regulator [Gluconobacter wancherniae]MBS1064301.1 LysR family transcriptional regulator [Gluconobacter wancherniae]MBS1089517.1 LysR family transcriptional regulator [Gluconobacter wancherniae]MBS1095617.1 LysR family transcriptional regulator [Gluconobacter wancherniae]